MSEFTVGTLFLARDREAVEHALKDSGLPHLVRNLNPRWSVILTPDEWLMQPDSRQAIRHVSEAAPLLHFSNAADHGWSFTLFHGGRERAAFAETYPWDPFFGLADDEDEATAPPAPPAAEELVYFRLLDLEPEVVTALGALLAQAPPPDQPLWTRVDGVKQLLGISEMSWISYRDATSDETSAG